MSGLAALGGIGHGLMQGSNFVQNKRQQDARLGMLQEEHGWKQQEQQAAQAERERVTRLSTMQNQIMQDYPDANEYQRQSMWVDTGVKENLFRGDELTQAEAMRKQMRNTFGVEAYDAALAGDIKPLQMILGERGSAVDFTPDRKGLVIYGQGGQKQEIPISGLLQLDAMGSAREREAARQQQALVNSKTEAEIAARLAQATASNASAANSYASANERRGNAAWEQEMRTAQRAIAAGTATPQQRALVEQGAQGGAGRGGSAPATVQTAQWLVDAGVAKDASEGWQMARTLGNKSPRDAIAALVAKMMADPMNMDVPPKELTEKAISIFQNIERRSEAISTHTTSQGGDTDYSSYWN